MTCCQRGENEYGDKAFSTSSIRERGGEREDSERRMSGVTDGEDKEHRNGEENMAAWLLGIKTLKIQPYHLPDLGK